MSSTELPKLPLGQDLENKVILKKLVTAHQALAELKGVAAPNQNILINTLALQEAKDSSAIESIITTHDELYQNDSQTKFTSLAAKEVHNYANALRYGFEEVKTNGFLSTNHILKIQEIIEENSAGFRRTPGTALINDQTGETIYTPPQHPDDILKLMNELEDFINNNDVADWDALIKMAIIHHQFESIHPFYDGNGRTGRIINILYLVKENLLSLPILYLSRYINQHKTQYYHHLQAVRKTNDWQDWLLFMLDAIEQTAKQTLTLITQIKSLMQDTKNTLRNDLPKIYSQDLLNNIFQHPYTKIDFVINDLTVSRPTASRYLKELVALGILSEQKLGRDNYYINTKLYNLLANIPS